MSDAARHYFTTQNIGSDATFMASPLLSFALTCAAGGGCILGGAIVFTPLADSNNTRFLAGALACSAGVMLMVSLTEIFGAAVGRFVNSGRSDGDAMLLTAIAFFVGMAVVRSLDAVLHSMEDSESCSLWCASCWCCCTRRHESGAVNRSHATGGILRDDADDGGVHAEDDTLLTSSEASSRETRTSPPSQVVGGSQVVSTQDKSPSNGHDIVPAAGVDSGAPKTPTVSCAPSEALVVTANETTVIIAPVGQYSGASSVAAVPVSATAEAPISSHHHAHSVVAAVAHNATLHDAERQKLMKLGLLASCAIVMHSIPESVATLIAGTSGSSVGFSIAAALAVHKVCNVSIVISLVRGALHCRAAPRSPPITHVYTIPQLFEGVVVSIPQYYSSGSRCRGFMWAVVAGEVRVMHTQRLDPEFSEYRTRFQPQRRKCKPHRWGTRASRTALRPAE